MKKERGSKGSPKTYDKEKCRPAVRSSICTGEQTAGFVDIKSGHFTEVMLVHGPGDLELFKREYGIEEEIKKIY